MISEAYAMATPPGGQAQGPAGIGQMLLPFAVIFLFFYFLILRPQKKKELTHRKYLESLKRGDEVITASGVMGRISSVDEGVVTLEIAQNVRIRVTQSSIAGPQPSTQGVQKA